VTGTGPPRAHGVVAHENGHRPSAPDRHAHAERRQPASTCSGRTARNTYGLFADPAQAQPRARLSGTVLHAGRRICALTGQPFTVAAIRTAGFEADLCLAGSEHPGLPAPGSIISGTVYLSAVIDTPLPHGSAS
jgi:hypothetical protein